jgi:NADH dehydrogenase
MDVHQHQLDYLAQARWHRFTLARRARGLDRMRREITIGAIRDDRGEQVIPPRTLRYDTLVIAIGSLANPFGVPGVGEHAFALDSAEEADHFNRRLVNAVLRANYHAEERNRELRVVIVGGGAPGSSSPRSCTTRRGYSPRTDWRTSIPSAR